MKAVSNDGYILEDESIQPKESARVIFDEEMMPLLFIERLEAWAVFGRQAYLQLADTLEKKGENYYYKDQKIETMKKISWS